MKVHQFTSTRQQRAPEAEGVAGGPMHPINPDTLFIPRDQWIPFLAQITRENRGAHAMLEVLGVDGIGRAVETEDRPFDGIAPDIKAGEDSVWIYFGSTPEDHITHGIQRVKAIWMRPPIGGAGATLEIEAEDGTRTLLALTLPEAYALPPAESQGRKS